MNYRILRILFSVTAITFGIIYFKHPIPIWYFFLPLIAFNIVQIIGAIFIQCNFYIKSINSVLEFKKWMPIDQNKKNICLTFDDGIHTINTPLALEILKKKNIQAHFYLIGKNIAGNESILKRMYEEGHVIGNHSWYHAWNFDLQRTKTIEKEINDTNHIIQQTIGYKPFLFRPPFGVTNPMVANAIMNTNMLSMGWNLRSLDTVAKSADELLQKLKRKTKPNAIILLHERCDITIEVLTEYIEYCLTEGYTFVTLNIAHEA